VRRRVTTLIGLWVGFGAGACVDGFRGSNVQIDLASAMPAQASVGAVPRANQLPSAGHFSIYGIQTAADRDRLFALDTFEIHPMVDVSSPCFIDVGDHVPHPGLHVSQYGAMIAADTGIPDYQNPPATSTHAQQIEAATAAQRMLDITLLGGDMGIKAVTSASESSYPTVAADCNGPAGQIPPAMCTDAASNQRRLELCQQAWQDDPALWEGTDRVLTVPLAGTTYGLVDGMNPINLAPVGGAQFFVDEALSSMDAFAIYFRTDAAADPGDLLLYGTFTQPTRGTSHVHLTGVVNPSLTAEMVIFADLGEDDVQF